MIHSSWKGQADVAIGNVVGSNIANVLLILGISAALAPLIVASQLIRWDVPLMITAAVAMWWMGIDGVVSRTDGVVLVTCLASYLFWTVRQSRRESRMVQEEFTEEVVMVARGLKRGMALNLAHVLGGLMLLVLGARWLVDASVNVARICNVSELMIGLTIVAVGTSLPELATSVIASARGQRDIAVGNVVGSNIFNVLAVLGISSVLAPAGIPVSADALRFDIPVMVATCFACLPVFFTGHEIARWEGAMFLFYYCAYISYLTLRAAGSPWVGTMAVVLFAFVVPLTVITLGIGVVRSLRERS
jgi:cation:H+ antiporter